MVQSGPGSNAFQRVLPALQINKFHYQMLFSVMHRTLLSFFGGEQWRGAHTIMGIESLLLSPTDRAILAMEQTE